MTISDRGVALIKHFEGCRLEAYKDPGGVWTIGYGHTRGVKEGDHISQTEAENLLNADIVEHDRKANAMLAEHGFALNQNQYDALVSFCYNCGPLNLSTLLKGRSTEEVGRALLLYNKCNGRVLNGLVRRRTAEQRLFFEPVAEDTNYDYLVRVGKWALTVISKEYIDAHIDD